MFQKKPSDCWVRSLEIHILSCLFLRPRRTGLKSYYVPVLQSVYLKVQDQGTVQSVFPNAINVLF